MKYTKSLLEKIEQSFSRMGYTIRYEKGSFQSGYCVVEQRNMIVINKFFEVEARINTLVDIFERLADSLDFPDDQTRKWFSDLVENRARKEAASQA